MKKWHVGVAFICTSVLLSFSATTVQADTHLSGKIQNVNQQEGSYEVVIDAADDKGITDVYVPTWSAPDQSDIVWYKAQKRSDGNYITRVNAKNHKNHRGIYISHVYAYNQKGKFQAKNLGKTKLNKVLSAEIQNINSKTGTYDVVVKDHIGGAVDSVSVPIWSTRNQSDLVWYPAQKNADGTWVVHMNIKNHKYHTGKYTTHVYMYTKNQGVHAINLGQTNVQSETEQLKGQIKNVNSKAGTYDVVIDAKSGAGIRGVSVPIWSTNNQSDLVWYPAQKQADGTWVVHMNIKNHKFHTGKYTTHVYATKNNGTEMAINLGQTDIPRVSDELSAKITNVNQQNGTYDVLINAQAQGGIREVKVPIWSTPNQSDLVWYKATKQPDEKYVVHMNISNHKNHRGTYMTHVYMYNNRGQQAAIALNNTNLPAIPDTLKAQIKNVNKEAGSYDVVIQAASQQGIARVEVPTWSTANQSDLVWYKATKQSDGSYIVHVNIKNHKNNRGNYTSHVYLWHPDGSNTAISLGETDLTKPIQEQPKPTEQPGKSDNNQQGNTNTGNMTEPTKPTEQPGKTEEPQVRELDIEKIKSEIVRLVNIERQSKGLNQLSVDRDLEDSARVRSVEIQTKYDHVRPDGSMYDTVFSKDDREISENANQNWHIAGLSEEQIAETLFTSWKNSPNHYKNMLVNRWTRMGIGISFNSTRQGVYAVQIFSTEPVTLDRNEDGNVEIPLN